MSGRLPSLLATVLLAAGALAGCGPPNGAVLVPEAVAGCEDPTQDQLNTNENMLPGRNCGTCHTAGGQATNSPWTVSGTVYGQKNSSCNSGGLAGISVEVRYGMADNHTPPLYQAGDRQPNGLLRTNASGNFWTAAHFVAPLTIRVFETDKGGNVTREKCMHGAQGRGFLKVNCADCHQFPGVQAAPGRIYLDDKTDDNAQCDKMMTMM